MSRKPVPEPRAWVAVGGDWPAGPFRGEAPGHVLVVAGLVREVKRYLAEEDRSANSLADLAGVDRGTLSRVLAGRNLPDLRTLHCLEVATGRPLWRGAT